MKNLVEILKVGYTLSYLCCTSFVIKSGTIALQNAHPPISGEIGETAIWRKFTRFALTFFVVKPRGARMALSLWSQGFRTVPGSTNIMAKDQNQRTDL